MTSRRYPIGDEEKFNRFIVEEYLKCGSVDEAYRKNNHDLPVSYANFQRILDRFGVVKAVGPNNKFSEAVDFLAHMVKDNIAFEKLYKKLPPSYRTSAVTLYRVLAYVKEGITRRIGCALIITPFNDLRKVLIAKDISTPNIEFGKYYGSYTIPMGYAKKGSSRSENVRRILQQEVFTNLVVDKKLPEFFLKDEMCPFMYLDVADVRVSVYSLQLPPEFSSTDKFSSYKLRDYEFVDSESLLSGKYNEDLLRAGVKESVKGYIRHLDLLKRKLSVNPLQEKSILNKELATVTIDVET
ncbi:MAG: hypothetical protein US75_C0020G0004 [Candidatus Woesebacteria bacterium GW2011_GWC1_38_13]|uniref:Uncharacterized protein n=3 Tax=Candidatus Woeseibacteriota TaxID=1752722 RepID=A0A0G0L4H7_9BACT|nr:MAG: hypothetical protein US67_C0030G0005 [Candidatus Woesebacteria bacterium GW2011_GWD1_38_10]KKQ55485.1 MAG: hypothetical protein US75_C0020G0004 [Candidatus Woesebacteria bacterium GW2011_GWC1_38_13]KKQ82770.1 MAG: hypothetical protein UT06_C0037G0006 [Candidatus Woesebacteria bacterium GW2011_GWA1_38_8]